MLELMLLLVLRHVNQVKIYEWQSLKQMKKCISINVKLKASFEADLNSFSKALKKLTVETALNAELTKHLGYEKNSPRIGKNTRNGYTT